MSMCGLHMVTHEQLIAAVAFTLLFGSQRTPREGTWTEDPQILRFNLVSSVLTHFEHDGSHFPSMEGYCDLKHEAN